MAKPCRIDDTVCVQPHREVVGSIFLPERLFEGPPEGLSELLSEFEGRPEGLSVTSSGGLSDHLPKGCLMREYILVVGRL
jgi:hypothetical protein